MTEEEVSLRALNESQVRREVQNGYVRAEFSLPIS